MEIDFIRLRTHLEELWALGLGPDGSQHRTAFSPGDMRGRAWFKDKIRAAGLVLSEDPAGNISALLPGAEPGLPVVATGSHLDTVPCGGPLDGALGVVAGLEALQSLKEQGVTLRHTLELINFSDEEGRFGGLLGSQAVAGQLGKEQLEQARDLEGVTLAEILEKLGLSPMEAVRTPDSLKCFVELHIEQGPILEERGIPLGVVDRVAGLFKWNLSFLGQPTHSGTTPMNRRKDALAGVAEFLVALEGVLAQHGSAAGVYNVGRIQAFPGVANVVPGRVDFTLEVRDTDSRQLEQMSRACEEAVKSVIRKRGLSYQLEPLSRVAPQPCAPEIVEALEGAAREGGHRYFRMASGAIHDCQIMGSVTPAAMLFVPSKDGKSHCPEEWTEWEQIRIGAEVLMSALRDLAC